MLPFLVSPLGPPDPITLDLQSCVPPPNRPPGRTSEARRGHASFPTEISDIGHTYRHDQHAWRWHSVQTSNFLFRPHDNGVQLAHLDALAIFMCEHKMFSLLRSRFAHLQRMLPACSHAARSVEFCVRAAFTAAREDPVETFS